MGLKTAGKSRKQAGHPYSKPLTLSTAVTDVTEYCVEPTVGSPSAGTRHAASGMVLFITTAGNITYRDGTGVLRTLPIIISTGINLPVAVAEIGGAGTTAVGTALFYFDD